MRKMTLLLPGICLLFSSFAFSQVSLTTANGTYSENFDIMGATGTAYPNGWTGIRYAGSGTLDATLTPIVSNGSSNTGGTHNAGATSSTERALGTLGSASTIPAFGVSFINNTGAPITGFNVSAYNEQWRSGSGNTVNEVVIFEYSTDAVSFSTGNWTAIPSLDLNEILTSTTAAAAVDGNANRVAISGSATALSIPAGGTLWLRWRDADNTGSDGIYAVDDLQMAYTNAAGSTVSVAAGANAAEPATNGSFTVSLSTPAPAPGTTISYALSGSATVGADFTDPLSGILLIPEGSSTGTITLQVADDAIFEGTENVSITLSSVSGTYSIAGGTASINVADNDAPPTIALTAGGAAAEPSANGSFTINLSTATTAPTDVNFAFSGTAVFGTDYSISYSAGTPSASTASGTLTIPPGISAITVTVIPANDVDVEGPETITLTLSSPTNSYVLGTSTGTINISSDDLPPIAPISLTGTAYTQDFNMLANTGTTNSLQMIPGWLMTETGGGARDNELYGADNGSSTTGDTYSYGLTGSSDRALGGLQSGSLIPVIGAWFVNNTGTTVSRLRITYTGEQWRLGTVNRTDQLDFQYSLDASGLTTGTWTDMDLLDFVSPFTATAGALNGNTNSKLISFTITGLSIPNGSSFYIRWNSFDASGGDDGLAIDDFSIETDPVDIAGPAIKSLTPANAALNIETVATATITFDENIQKGSGNIYVRRLSDNAIVQTIGVATAALSLPAPYQASFDISGLAFSTTYYVEADPGAFKDVLGNDFAGISGNAAWSFTTVPPPPAGVLNSTYTFDLCTAPFSNGFTQFSAVGAQKWECTGFGTDATHSTTGSAPNGIQINGFSGTNIPNEDWFISPSFDLSSTTYPLLSFWSRTAFNGVPLKLKVSTDYPGTGNPNNYTWTDVNGRFPGQTSNVWTLSDNINLSAYKSPATYFAFVYYSSDDDGARWTLDDIRVDNSETPPPPSLTVSITDMQFTYVAGGASADKAFTFIGNDLVNDVALAATGDFLLSKDGSSFSPAINFSAADANNVTKTVFVRFAPAQNNQNYAGTIAIGTSSLSSTINLKGTSIDPATTLEVVNWNMEWFGSTDPSLGPTNDALQEQNAKAVLQNIGADLYALVEVVDESRLANIVSQMPGYSYVICNYGSHTNTNESNPGPLSEAQKEAFVYKTSIFSNISTTPLLSQGINSLADLSNPAYSYWSSGRFPFMLSADVTLNCVTKHVRFVLCHAKANTSPTATSYDRRKKGADTLYYTLNQLFPNDNVVILGDLNDDLDQSITAGFTVTSWNAFTDDAANYSALTLPLSLAGKKSTVEYNDIIDHVIASNEMADYYMPGSANILTDVAGLVNNYGNTTSDHYPAFTRYKFELPPSPVIICPGDITVNNTAGACGATVNFNVTYSGGCGAATLHQIAGLASGSVFPAGSTTNTFVVTDGAGGSDTCTFIVKVIDTQSPTIACPANIAINASAGNCGAVVNYAVPFADNCSATIQQTAGLPSGSVFPAGTTTNTFIVTDAGGLTATCSFTVTVTDHIAPTFTRPADITIPLTGTCVYDASPAITGDVTNEADNCSAGIQATYSDVVSECGDKINIKRTWKLSDGNGNQAPNQVQTITITDNNTSYVVYATTEARFDQLNLINGAVGVTGASGKATIKAASMLPSPYFVKAKNIDVSFLAYVPTRYYTPANDGPNPAFYLFAGSTGSLPVKTISASTTVPVTANYRELKIKKGVTVTIAGTLYGKVEIEEGATVTFAPAGGIVNIETLKAGGKITRITRIKFSSCTSVRVKDKVEIDDYTLVNADGPRVTFYLGDTNTDDEQFLVDGISNIIAANIYVRKGEIRVKGSLNIMKGWFMAERVISEGLSVAWTGNECNGNNITLLTKTNQQALSDGGGEEPVKTSLEASVSPNPSSDQFLVRIQSGNTRTPVMVRITDMNGRVVSLRQGIAANSSIQVGAGLVAGVYLAEVIQGKERKVIRLMKL